MGAMGNFFSHPALASEVLSAITQKEIEIPRVLKLISCDSALCLQILKYANTSIYDYSRRISSLERAVVVLGVDLVKELTLYFSMKSLFQGIPATDAIYLNRFWKHSLNCALALKVLADHYDSAHKDHLYCSGLLHDIGKQVLYQQFGEEYLLLAEKSANENLPLIDLEKKFLGTDHTETGAAFLENWDLPVSLVQTSRYHHAPHEYKSGDLVDFWIRLVYLGNIMAHFIERELPGGTEVTRVETSFRDYLSMTATEFTQLLQQLQKEVSEQQKILNILN